MSADACPHCGGELRFLEKDTSSGREFREYRCLNCGKFVTLGGDTALWKVLHEANAAGKPPKKRWWQFWTK
jgi:DNA-directed RNA polymerase subunit RPC12/RpoP